MDEARGAGRPRILLMDDEEQIRAVAALFLRKAGYDVVPAANGAEAVALYREALDAGERFACVILDVNVPGGMGGRAALARLREIDPRVRAFVSSGCPEDPLVVNHRACGFAGAIEKPDFYLRPTVAQDMARLLAAPCPAADDGS